MVGGVVLIGIAALPAGMGVAILKYRLYEIDRIISRTLAYTIVTGLLVGVYAGLVLLARQVFSANSPVAVAASTLAVAALFSPARRRVQRVVDRRFNRVRYDADRMVEAFAVRLNDATDLDRVRADLTSVVSQALAAGLRDRVDGTQLIGRRAGRAPGAPVASRRTSGAGSR